MAGDDEFKPRLGSIGDAGKASTPRYLGRVLAAVNLARGGAARKGGKGAFSGSRTGRGHGVGRVLASRSGQGGLHARRVIVKASIIMMTGRGAAAAAAHMRYLQRDGTTREGERGTLYGRDEEALDGKAFGERCAGDRHQFRFIVSPEDGDQYEDLKPLTRRLMARMEQDLGTKLDWVAVDHFNTGHPHSHILVRGKDERGEDLVIARDYMTRGLRERACELVDLDLGPRTMREVETVLKAEVEQERLTSLDRALLRSAGPEREVAVSGGSAFDQTLRAGRLAKLARMGLAESAGEGRFRLAPDLAETLKRMGERGDIIRTMQREFSRAGVERSAMDQVIHDPARVDAQALVGRVMAHGLSDEHADRHYLIVDALDGRSHYVDAGQGKDLALAGDHLRAGAIVRIEGARAGIRPSDRVIAEVSAAHGGRYDVELHLRHDPTATENFARTHVRRLEVMRRGGGAVTREPSGQWIIAPDHLERVLAWEEKQVQGRPVTITSLSTQSLERMVDVEAATWIDRALVEKGPGPLSGDLSAVRDAGFGHDLRDAIDRRRQWLVAQGFAEEGATGFAKGMLEALQRRELLKVAGQLSGELGLSFEEARQGQRIEGIYRRPVELLSGRFAVIERAKDFTLVPWKPVLERRAGQGVSGLMRGDEVNWSVGRGRNGPDIS
ncbi:MAG: conjugal transfer protein TraI [Novosphingobium sp. 63-713]|uniref:relaxase/mobilization nuclease RlxS n=1 Tax=unclassified Novosphingobium TaxID=2644732 RepID=UPI00095B7833|nr:MULTISPECIES: relaxase/mobilization nuclease RlxS [unclassified Novosphingobium]MBN9144626.1 relaxase/mobilization nuclease and DUF3363 domain-containing protein [Novosphingobium sp.]OJX92050.1 MAG: conjugal transfer protein TraI [Novosphingobium sp. 63-713]